MKTHLTPEHRANISKANKGRQFSDEHRSRLSAAHEGRDYTAFHAAGRVAGLGKHHSTETRQRLREMKAPKPVLERLKAKTVVTDVGCWEWTGYRQPIGYGVIGLGSRVDGDKRTALVHRVSWEETNGPIPDGFHVCHHCDNRPCWNPDHLFLGTREDNMQDMLRKERRPGQVTDAAAHEIANLKASGLSQAEIAHQTGFSQATISRVLHPNTSAH